MIERLRLVVALMGTAAVVMIAGNVHGDEAGVAAGAESVVDAMVEPTLTEEVSATVEDATTALPGSHLPGMPDAHLQDGKGLPLTLSVGLTNSVGVGTIVTNPDTNSPIMPRFATSLSLRPSWRLSSDMILSGRFDLHRENVDNYYSAVTYPGQLFPSDTVLSFSHRNLLTLGGEAAGDMQVTFGGALGLILPTSLTSRNITNMYAATSPSLFGSLRAGGFVFTLSESYTKYFSKYKSQARAIEDDKDYPTGHPRTAEELPDGLYAMRGMNRDWALTHTLSVSRAIVGSLSGTMALTVVNRFYYRAGANDPEGTYHSPYANPDENQRDFTMGVFELNYQQNRNLRYALGMSSSQPAKTADGRSFRFPFYDSRSPANNFTNFYLDLVASF